MKISPAIFGIVVAIVSSPFATFGYDIFLPDDFEGETNIFDASIGLQGCQYEVKGAECNHGDVWFSINESSGVVSVSKPYNQGKNVFTGVVCSVTILVKGCGHLEKIEIPVVVHIIALEDLKWMPAELQHPTKVSLNISAVNYPRNDETHSSWVDVLQDGRIEDFLPASLQSCVSEAYFDDNEKDAHLRIKDGTILIGKNFFNKERQCEIVLKHQIRDCLIESNQNAIIPNQEVVVKIKTLREPDHKSHRHAHLPEASLRKISRRRRSHRRTFSFNPKMKIVEVSENGKSGTRVVALHLNNPGKIPVTFSWHPTTNKRSLEAFSLNARTGVVTTKKVLDRENMASHGFRVTAQGSGGHTADCTLLINVIDMNDNTPKFEKSEYRFHLSEDEYVGAYVGKVTASDDDSGENQRIQYSIRGLLPRNIFSISGDGEITLNGEIDREKKAEYSFSVVATDSGVLPQSSTTKVTISIDDVNDVTPTFTRSQYHVRIGEDTKRGTKIVTVKATDNDAGINGKVTYSLVMSQDRNYFSINRETGEITVISDINFENHRSGFRLRVRAQDGGRPPRSSSCVVVVNVVDVNDNKPEFLSPSYDTVVSENLVVRSEILQVRAIDSDAGENARITYSFITPPSNLPFHINNTSGQITLVRKLDYERTKAYRLTVRATDHGSPPKFSTATVLIRVRNINDNTPTFTQPVYRVLVPETTSVGKEIMKVTAKDQDEGTTLHYRILSGNSFNKFGIITRNNEGVITLARSLDFNQKRSYVLIVMCSDGVKSSTTQVRINVTDANTHAPVFDKSSYQITVAENVKVGTAILHVHATDRDVGENARITYELQAPSSEFSLNTKTGEIKTKVLLDYDTLSQLYLTVVAKDNGIPKQQSEALVTIYLTDVNDNAPVFDQPEYSAVVLEDVRIGTSVTRIRATDRDAGKNGQVFYTFQGGNDGNGHFKIDQSNGVIRTAQILDREHIAQFPLVAYATDRGSPPKRTRVAVTVTVGDVDDNPPKFPSDEITFEVPEDSPVGSIVAKLHAVDPDENGHSKVLYELASVDALEFWDLNYETGELSPNFPLDYETKANYTLRVSAYSNQLLSQVKVNINLIDVNDNPPVLNDFQIIFNNYRTNKPYTFPFGPIGKIPAHDPDVSSVLRYRFTSGNNNSLLILNETTGELRLSSKLDNDREFTATFMVEVSDGKYSVPGKCTLKVIPITDEMLTNSVTVRVQEMSQENFLSNAMNKFVHGLGQILNVSTLDVYIFNVQNDTDVAPHAVVNVSFSARRPAGSFFTTQHLQEQVYLNRSLLTNYSMQNVMPFDDNICLREPCENYMRCVSALYFNSSAPFVSTRTILFRPIHPVSGLRCKCPAGFAGRGCENEVNLCHPSKCKNGGQCLSVEGGYVCACNGSFAGRHCEVNLVGSQCNEAKDICKNGAKCHPFPAGGFRCDCNPGGLSSKEVTQFCELRGRSFRKGDFIMFSGITRQWRFTLSLSFATREKDGLLLYNGRFNHEHDYLALEIIDGQVQLNFSTGQHFTIVSPFVPGGVNDGSWHTVEIEYRNKPKREVLGRQHTGPSNIKVVTVTVDPETCDPAISAKWHQNLSNHTCSKTAEQGGTKSSLDLTTPLLIGGVPNLPEAYQVRSRYFVGCVRDVHIDHRLIDMSTYVANHGSQPGCKALKDHCSDNPCSRGTCTSVWNTYKCTCDAGYGGKRCERIQPVHRFQGYGCLKLQQSALAAKPMALPWKHTLSIRTTRPTGTVLHMKVSSSVEIEMEVRQQKLAYSAQIGRSKYQDEVDAIVNDGEWHEIIVQWKKVGQNIRVEITIDGDFEQDSFMITNIPSTLNPSRGRITELYLGGHWTGSRVSNAFVGCIQGLEFTSQSIVYSFPEESLAKTRGARITQGCQVTSPCKRKPNPCPERSDCIQKFDTYSCKCHKGYIGNRCESVCVLNPCKNGAKCVLRPSEQYGYKCQCPSKLYYGRTCQMEHIHPCPTGWWGDIVCVPCNCAVEKNFDPDCNTNGGKCRCKKNHYYNSEKDMCLPCDCYHVGSIGHNCTDETGQCRCKPKVVGKKCNMCSSNFAEVQDDGCSVLYGMCPQVFADGITWRRAKFGATVPARCAKDATGLATRVCNKEKGWLAPTLGNCTSLRYHDLENDLKNLLNNKQYFSEHSDRLSMDAVTRLYEASNNTVNLYEGDVLVSYKIVMKILSAQNSLSGFDLMTSRRKNFNKYLIDSTSHALDSRNLVHWKALQRGEKKGNTSEAVNSAKLLQTYEEYVATLTENMNSIWYPSITELAPNIKMRIKTVSNLKEEIINAAGDDANSDNDQKVVPITLLLPEGQDQKGLPSNGTVGVIEFSTLGEILPMEFHDNRLDMRIPQKPFINSAVVTVVIHDRVNRSSRLNRDIITMTFPLLRNDGSDPQCVFWNFTSRTRGGVGGWSQKGCSTKKSNKTHVTCSCSHLTSFAVVSDEEVVSVLNELPIKIILYGSVAIILSCIIICLGFSWCLEDVKSNHAKIHNSFSVSVFFSELIFAVGIMQTSNNYACMAVAIFIHFFFMSTFAWVFVEGLHLYRMLKEKRNVDRGNMRVYYLIGWGVPAMITALSVGLDAKGFGNANFCWIRIDHLLIWSFAGPLLFCAIVYILLFFMTLGEYFTLKLPDTKRFDMRANLRASFILLPTVAGLWGLALFAVNENQPVYYYLFSFVNVLLGIMLLLLHCVFNKEVRGALRAVKERRWQRAELNTTKQHLLKSPLSQTPDTSNGPRRIDRYTSASSTSTTNTANRRNNLQDSSLFHNMSDLDLTDDSDSDLSNSSMSLASSHSSDEEDADEKPTYLNVNNCNSWQHKNGHLPIRRAQEGELVVHSTPKEKDIDDDHHPPQYNGTASSKGDSYVNSLPTVSESNLEREHTEEPHYLAINSSRKENGKKKEDKMEMIPLQDMDSLPKKGILKNGRRSKPPTPVRTDSLQRTHSPLTTADFPSDETSLIKKRDTLEKVASIRNSPCPSQQEQLL